ncbi:hypothetical protein [Helicobacter sp. 23-1045]
MRDLRMQVVAIQKNIIRFCVFLVQILRIVRKRRIYFTSSLRDLATPNRSNQRIAEIDCFVVFASLKLPRNDGTSVDCFVSRYAFLCNDDLLRLDSHKATCHFK